jgi:hypothetical protein
MSNRKMLLCVAAALVGIAATGSKAHAIYVEDISQVGSDVDATGSGTLNLTALIFQGSATNLAQLNPGNPGAGIAFFGPATGTFSDEYAGFTSGASTFGSVSGVDATSGSGDIVGVAGLSNLIVPNGYVSGDSLADTSTWAGQTYSSLGLTGGPGTYTWEWGSGPTFDAFIMVLEPAPVPEPASLALFGIGGLGLLVFGGRHFLRRRAGEPIAAG